MYVTQKVNQGVSFLVTLLISGSELNFTFLYFTLQLLYCTLQLQDFTLQLLLYFTSTKLIL